MSETALYEQVWSAIDTYGSHSPGEQVAAIFADLVREQRNVTTFDGIMVLDAGCGSGKGAVALHAMGFTVRLCDLTNLGLTPEAKALPFTEASLTGDLSHVVRAFGHPSRITADYVYCCDVLEHIPTQFTMLAINQMLRVSRYGLFLSISLVPDVNGIWVGEALHKTVQPFAWWRDNLKELGTVLEARDLLDSALFLVAR